MNLSSVVMLIAMAFSLVHCGGGDGSPGSPDSSMGSLVLVNNAHDGEDVRYAFDVSPGDEGVLLKKGDCVSFNGADLSSLTVWASSGFLDWRSNYFCSGNSELSKSQCEAGTYQVYDDGWLFDTYKMAKLEEDAEDESADDDEPKLQLDNCAPVSKS